MNENVNVPKIRFKEFNNDWEQRKLKDITSIITKGTTPLDKSGTGNINFIKIENINPNTGIIESNSKITEEEHNGYLKRSQLKENDLLFSIAGTLGRVCLVNKGILPANTNQALAIIRLKECDLSYIKTFLKGKVISDFIKKNPTIGAQPNLSLEQVSSFEISYPGDNEARRIGVMLDSLDNLITLHQSKYDELLKVKKIMLEKMFPQSDKKIPLWRFKEFTNDWEHRKLLDTIESIVDYRGRTPKKLGYHWSEDGILALSALNVKMGFIDTALDAHYGDDYLYSLWMKDTPLYKGQVLLTTEAPAGNVAQIPDNKRYILSQRTIAFKVKNNIICDNYLAKVLSSPNIQNKISNLSTGGTAKGVSQRTLSELTVLLPKTIKEQNKISKFISNIDTLITLHQKKLDKLNNIKKALLEKMFV